MRAGMKCIILTTKLLIKKQLRFMLPLYFLSFTCFDFLFRPPDGKKILPISAELGEQKVKK